MLCLIRIRNIAILTDYDNQDKNPSMSMARAFLNTFQDHYPERMGLCLLIHIPFFINVFLKILTPFVDPLTRQKIKLNPQVVEDGLVAREQLIKDGWGGDIDFEYEHRQFFPALVKMSCERKERWMTKWKKLGATIGTKEWDYKRD